MHLPVNFVVTVAIFAGSSHHLAGKDATAAAEGCSLQLGEPPGVAAGGTQAGERGLELFKQACRSRDHHHTQLICGLVSIQVLQQQGRSDTIDQGGQLGGCDVALMLLLLLTAVAGAPG